MTHDEHKEIIAFVESVANPDHMRELPLDVEADAIIRALFVRNPEAAYRVMTLAMAQAKELTRVKTEFDEMKQSFRGNWLSRLLKKEDMPARNRRRESRLAIFPNNLRSR